MEKAKSSTWNDMFKPVVVLTAICIIVSGLLGYFNGVTRPIIERNAAIAADAARTELLPSATDGFTLMETDMDGIREMYKANNGTGYVITSTSKGYGGDVIMMTAFDNDGNIVNLKVQEHQETAGLGSRVADRAFLDQFVGRNDELSSKNVDMISGSTISSNTVISALNIARRAFNEYVKGEVVVELTLEEKLGKLFGEDVEAAVLVSETGEPNPRVEGDKFGPDYVAVYETSAGKIVCATGRGNGIRGEEHLSNQYVRAYVAFNEDGTIAGVFFDDSTETAGLGTRISDEDWIANFIGQTNGDNVDTIANATYSSKGAIEAVNNACAAYARLS
jgi:RnfABCDGE-type electron transport complex G subunit